MGIEERQRVALITGANRGIGLETARQLAQRGLHVVFASRDEEKGRRAAKDIETVGKVSVLPLDVSSSESVQSAVQRFGEIADRLDVLVNPAGVYPDEGQTVLTLPRNQLVQTFQTNTIKPLKLGASRQEL